MSKLVPASMVLVLSIAGLTLWSYGRAAEAAQEEAAAERVAKAAAAAAAAPAEKLPPYRLVAPLEVLMDSMDTMFYELEDKIAEKKLRTVKKTALFLAEVSNVVFYAKEGASNRKGWAGHATATKESLLALSKAAEAKKEAEVKALWAKTEELCEACHDDFAN